MFSLSFEPIIPLNLRESLTDSTTGAFVSFEGIVRNHNDGKQILSLDYEAYPDLCQAEAQKIFDEAYAQFPISKARCVHRTGHLNVGDMAVWVGVSASHRDEAFKACRYIIDEIKKRLPIWKKETTNAGDSGWINCERASTTTP